MYLVSTLQPSTALFSTSGIRTEAIFEVPRFRLPVLDCAGRAFSAQFSHHSKLSRCHKFFSLQRLYTYKVSVARWFGGALMHLSRACAQN